MKFYGKVGFSVTEDQGDGVWKEKIAEKTYSGDVLQYTRRKESGEHINDGLRINVQISILCLDPWFQDNISQIRYVEYQKAKWVVESIDPTKYPSVVLTLGGLYHGYEPDDGEPDEPEEGETEEVPEDSGGDSGE